MPHNTFETLLKSYRSAPNAYGFIGSEGTIAINYDDLSYAVANLLMKHGTTGEVWFHFLILQHEKTDKLFGYNGDIFLTNLNDFPSKIFVSRDMDFWSRYRTYALIGPTWKYADSTRRNRFYSELSAMQEYSAGQEYSEPQGY